MTFLFSLTFGRLHIFITRSECFTLHKWRLAKGCKINGKMRRTLKKKTEKKWKRTKQGGLQQLSALFAVAGHDGERLALHRQPCYRTSPRTNHKPAGHVKPSTARDKGQRHERRTLPKQTETKTKKRTHEQNLTKQKENKERP